MRDHITLLGTLLTSASLLCNAAQSAAFLNLDFEAASLPSIPQGQYGSYVPASDALPGWSVFAGSNSASQALHNNITTGPATASVLGPDWPYGIGGRIEGDFTALLASSVSQPLSITQTGMVPADSQWLFFKAWVSPSATAFTVSLNGEVVPMNPVATYADYTLFGGDVSNFAGSEAELWFRVLEGRANTLTLDSIVFSPVPEPGSLALLALAFFGAACFRRRHAKGRHS